MANSMIIFRIRASSRRRGKRYEKKKDERKKAYHGEKVTPKDFLLHQELFRESESRRRASLRQSWWLPGHFVYRLQVIHPPCRLFSRLTSTKPTSIKPASRKC